MQGETYTTDLTVNNANCEYTLPHNSMAQDVYQGNDSYWLGRTVPPQFMRTTTVTLVNNPETTELIFKCDSDSNSQVRFQYVSNYSALLVDYHEFICIQDEKYHNTDIGYNANYRLVNKLNASCIRTNAPKFGVMMLANIYKQDGDNLIYIQNANLSYRDCGEFGGDYGETEYNNFMNILNNGAITVISQTIYLFDDPHYVGQASYSITYNTSDFENGAIEVNTPLTVANYVLKGWLFIGYVDIIPNRDMATPFDELDNSGYSGICPLIETNESYLSMCSAWQNFRVKWENANDPVYAEFALNTRIRWTISPRTHTMFGGLDGINIYRNDPIWTTTNMIKKIGNSVAICVGQYWVDFWYPITLGDIRNYMKMFPRFWGGVPVFNEDYEPEFEFTNDTNEWQDWQLDTSENEYDGVVPEPDEQEDEGIEEMLPEVEGELPSINENRTIASPSNFITQYVLTESQISSLGTALWGDKTMLQNLLVSLDALPLTGTGDISQLLNLIVSLRVFPITISDHVTLTSVSSFNIGTGDVDVITGTLNTIPTPSFVVQCGSVTIQGIGDNNYNDFRDYFNCTISVYLPYCGIVELNPADVWGRTVRCAYYVDIQSGNCTATLFCNYGARIGEMIVASKSGQIGFLLPITATNAAQVTGVFMQDAQAVIQGLTSVIASAASANIATEFGNSFTGNNANIGKNISSNAKVNLMQSHMNQTGGMIGGLGNMISRSGVGIPYISGGAGLSAMYTVSAPYVVIRRSLYTKPENYASTVGKCSSSCVTIGSCRGFNAFINPDLSGVSGTEEELNELKYLLETGIYI